MSLTIPHELTGRSKRRDYRDEGFTLLELIVTVVILGVLAAIALPAFSAQKQSAQDASVKSDLVNAAIAAEAYSVSHNGSYAGLTTGALSDQYHVSNSPSNVVVVASVSATSYTLKAYNLESGANRVWWLSAGSITGPTGAGV